MLSVGVVDSKEVVDLLDGVVIGAISESSQAYERNVLYEFGKVTAIPINHPKKSFRLLPAVRVTRRFRMSGVNASQCVR
jgi:hypothetical protein